jgi:serine/threonine-protein kinase
MNDDSPFLGLNAVSVSGGGIEASTGQLDPLLGRTIAERYEVKSVLGAGGWSTVYCAYDRSLERNVALKVMHSHLSLHDDKVTRFQQEARVASSFVHPNLATIFDVGLLPGNQPFMVMELIEGKSIYDLLKEQKLFSADCTAELALQICDGLTAMH